MSDANSSFFVGVILLMLGIMIIAGAGIMKGKEIMILETAK